MEQAERLSLREMARRQGVTVEDMVGRAVIAHGTVKEAAAALGVHSQTLYQWINRNGYRVETAARIVKE